MAIDTQTKRRSVSGYSGLIIAPLADGAVSANDREHVAGLYAGITAGSPAGSTLMALERSAFRRIFGRIFGRVN